MPKRVLVVDDSNLMRNRISQCLTNAGYEVVGKAKDGDEAIDLYSRMRPDAVTLDITMRGKDGIAAAEEILKVDSEAAIVFYTLLDIPDLAARIDRLGVRNVVRKGDEQDLLKTLGSLG